MGSANERQLDGIEAVRATTALLQRRRQAHPTFGVFEAAELEWAWRVPRSTDTVPQLFWFDDDGQPVAAAIAIDFGDGSSALYEDTMLFFMYLPDATPELIGHIVERGVANATAAGIEAMELEVDREDKVLHAALLANGFTLKSQDAMVESWLQADKRPEVSPLADGYRLLSRSETTHLPHHLAARNGDGVEARLQQTSLYRADLDLVVLDADDNPAAFGLFWFDPSTATGVVEPMRTHDDHQQKGLARHVLTAGVELLAKAGAERISICYEPDNPASGHLYRSVGFEPDRINDVYARVPTG